MSSGLAGSMTPDGSQSPTCPHTCRVEVHGDSAARAGETAGRSGRRALGLRGDVVGGPQGVHGEAATGEPSGPGRLGRGQAQVSVAETQSDTVLSVTGCGTHSRAAREVQDVKVTPFLILRPLVVYADGL